MTREIHLLVLCAALAAGEACGFAGAPLAALWPLLLVVVALTALFGYGCAVRGWWCVAVFGLGLVLALRTVETRQAILDDVQTFHCGEPYPADFTVKAPVTLRKGRDDRTWVSFPSALGPVPVRVILPCAAGTGVPREGERWTCSGWLARSAKEGARRAFWVCGGGSFAHRSPGGDTGLAARRRRVRTDLSARLGLGLAARPRVADLHRAILLGERARLDPALKADFVAAGTIHVFAISGLHVMIVARVLAFLLLWTRLPVRCWGLVLVPVLWAYAYLTGFAPSAVRATTLLTLTYAAPLVWRRPNGLVAWALTFLGVYGVSPERLQDVGCGLSFAVMLALVLWSRWGVRTKRWWIDVPLFTGVAWAASLPIAAHVFGRLTPGGLLANLALGPLAAGSVVGSFVGLLLSFVSADLAAVANNLAAVFTELLVGLSGAVASLPGASVEISPWSLGTCFLWYLAMAALWLAVRQGYRRRHAIV